MRAWAKLTAIIFVTDLALGLAVRGIIGAAAAAVERASRPPEPLRELLERIKALSTDELEELTTLIRAEAYPYSVLASVDLWAEPA